MCTFKNLKKFQKSGKIFEKTSGNPDGFNNCIKSFTTFLTVPQENLYLLLKSIDHYPKPSNTYNSL